MSPTAATTPLHLSVESCPDPADLALLEEKVAAAVVTAVGVDEEQELAVVLRHPDGTLAAGAAGVIVGGCLDVQSLWVEEPLRRCGVARELLDAAEGEARRRGCSMAILHAYDVTTHRLFERLGYQLVGVIDDALAGTPMRWYRKDL